jgi:hypothetical protein
MTTEDIRKRWHWDALRRDVERLFGRDQLHPLNQCLRTINDRRAFARYHYQEAENKMAAVIRGRPEPELTAVLLGAFDTDELSFDGMQFEAYAHTVACVQNMHAVADNMIHFVYYALGLNLAPSFSIKNERGVTWGKVKKILPLGPIEEGLTSLNEDPGFIYLAALSNHSKHRSIIEVDYTISYESDTHGLRFTPFTYGGVPYPAKWVHPTLRNEYHRQEDLIHSIGTSVNVELASRP